MGVFYSLNFLFILFFLFIPTLLADNYSITNNNHIKNSDDNDINTSNPSPSPSFQHSTTPFKPTIAVIVAVLTTLFSITFLLLLYAKHCGTTRNNNNNNNHTNPFIYTHSSVGGRNSGINRAVVESLPLFRFSSLRGRRQKEGLECAVCLTRFQPNELLRLLPKCKHAFHVECVDTWLDAHSTCPLCRYRVDPEDILLINQDLTINVADAVENNAESSESSCSGTSRTRRVSGRHSYAAGERSSKLATSTSWFRRSLDSSASGSSGVCRKDGLLLLSEDEKKRLEHRIIVSGSGGDGGGGESGIIRNGSHQRWSDVQPSDLLYLRSEMIIISQSRKLGRGGSLESNSNGIGVGIGIDGGNGNIGRSIINSRSVSEITGLSRFSSKASNKNDNNSRRGGEEQARAAGLVSRWLAWFTSTSHSDVVPSQPVQTKVVLPY